MRVGVTLNMTRSNSLMQNVPMFIRIELSPSPGTVAEISLGEKKNANILFQLPVGSLIQIKCPQCAGCFMRSITEICSSPQGISIKER